MCVAGVTGVTGVGVAGVRTWKPSRYILYTLVTLTRAISLHRRLFAVERMCYPLLTETVKQTP